MLVLGIDPGSRATGFGVIESRGDRLKAVDFGVLPGTGRGPLEERLATLYAEMAAVVERTSPDVAALETPFSGLNPKSLIVLAQARGALLAAIAGQRLPVHEYAPAQVKVAVTGHGRADKEQVAHMVRLLLSINDESLSHDATDALAVAICCAHRIGFERMAADTASAPTER